MTTPQDLARKIHRLNSACRCLLYDDPAQEAKCALFQAALIATSNIAPQQEGERVRECWLPGTGWNACNMPHCDYKQRTVIVLPEGSAAKEKPAK